jgi:hypothetical protein
LELYVVSVSLPAASITFKFTPKVIGAPPKIHYDWILYLIEVRYIFIFSIAERMLFKM